MLCPLIQTPERRRWGPHQRPTQQAVVSSVTICNKATATPGGAAEASAMGGLIRTARALALLGAMGFGINCGAPYLL